MRDDSSFVVLIFRQLEVLLDSSEQAFHVFRRVVSLYRNTDQGFFVPMGERNFDLEFRPQNTCSFSRVAAGKRATNICENQVVESGQTGSRPVISLMRSRV